MFLFPEEFYLEEQLNTQKLVEEGVSKQVKISNDEKQRKTQKIREHEDDEQIADL
jgi:hypothetical protein